MTTRAKGEGGGWPQCEAGNDLLAEATTFETTSYGVPVESIRRLHLDEARALRDIVRSCPMSGCVWAVFRQDAPPEPEDCPISLMGERRARVARQRMMEARQAWQQGQSSESLDAPAGTDSSDICPYAAAAARAIEANAAYFRDVLATGVGGAALIGARIAQNKRLRSIGCRVCRYPSGVIPGGKPPGLICPNFLAIQSALNPGQPPPPSGPYPPGA